MNGSDKERLARRLEEAVTILPEVAAGMLADGADRSGVFEAWRRLRKVDRALARMLEEMAARINAHVLLLRSGDKIASSER